MPATHDGREVVGHERTVLVLGKVLKGRLECGAGCLVEMKDGQDASDGQAEQETRVASSDKIEDAARAATSLVERRADWNVPHAGAQNIILIVVAPFKHRREPGFRAWLAVATVVGVVMVTALTYPLVPKMGSVARFDNGDGRFSVWNVAWVAHALLTDPRHLLDANIFAPHTGTLAYSELNLVAGVMAVPAYALTKNPLAAHNFAAALALWLSFMCMWALVRRLTGSPLAGLVSATAYTFCPYLLSHTSHIQLLMAFVIPLNFLALHRLLDVPSWWRGVQLGLAIVISGLACGYYGIYGGIALGVAALWFSRRGVAYWRALAIAGIVAVAIVAPILVAFERARSEVGGGTKYTAEDMRGFSAQPSDYLVSGAKAHELWKPAKDPARDPEPLFPGVTILALAFATVITTARGLRQTVSTWTVLGYGLVGTMAAVASLGPKYWLYTVFFHVVPAIGHLRAPSRFGLIVAIALAILGGVAVSNIRQRRWLAVVLLAFVALESGASTSQWGWPSWPVQQRGPVPTALRVLATLPPGVTVEYPFPYISENVHNHTDAMLNSTYHWQPLVNGYSDIVPDDFYKIMLPINYFPDDGSFKLMAQYHVRYVLWRIDTYNAESRKTLESRFPPFAKYLKPIVTSGDVWLYEITSYPAS